MIKRNPAPGSPAWEEIQKKKAAKNPPIEGENNGSVAVDEPEKPKGQRQQPKKKKKKDK